MDTVNTLTTSTPNISLTDTRPPTLLLTPEVLPDAVLRWLDCEICEARTRHTLEDTFYVCEICKNEIRYVINEARPMWAIR